MRTRELSYEDCMRLYIAIAVLFFPASLLMAQTVELKGMVTDESGAIVPGAKVTITGPGGTTQEAIVGSDGAYSIANLSANTYTVKGSAPDLASQAAKIDLKPGLQTLNIQLKVVAAGQQVTVVDQVALVTPEPSNNASATVLEGNSLDAL